MSITHGVQILEAPTSTPADSDKGARAPAADSGHSVLTPAPPSSSSGGTNLLTPASPLSPGGTEQESTLHPLLNPSSTSSAPEPANAPLLVPAPTTPAASEQEGPGTDPALTSAPPASDVSPDQPSAALNPDSGVLPSGAANPTGDGNFSPSPGATDIADRANESDPAVLSSAIKVPDAAGLSVQIRPGPQIAAGSPVSFEITTKKAGYLILVEVNATGKVVQVYPDPMSLMQPKNVREEVNFIRPGRVVRLPDATNPYSGFEFVASPPRGTAMVVALLSELPVQLLDLPDLSGPGSGGAATVEDFVKYAGGLRVPDRSAGGGFGDAHWSFAVTAYAVR